MGHEIILCYLNKDINFLLNSISLFQLYMLFVVKCFETKDSLIKTETMFAIFYVFRQLLKVIYLTSHFKIPHAIIIIEFYVVTIVAENK